MKAFPSVNAPPIDIIERIFYTLTSEYKTNKQISSELKDVDKRVLSNALSIMTYLNLIEAKGRGRTRRYKRGRDEFKVVEAFINARDVSEVLRFIGMKITRREDIAVRVYGKLKETKATKLRRISAIASMARDLNILSKKRKYELTEMGENLLFEFYLEKIYTTEKEREGLPTIPIPIIRDKICSALGISRKVFDEKLIALAKKRDDLVLSPAPAVTEEIRRGGIPSERGVLYHLRLNALKLLMK